MALKSDAIDRASRRIAGLMITAAVLVSTPALAEPTDLEELAKSPQAFLGEDVEIVGYCVKGGVKGDVLGYECTTEAGVYLNTGDIEPEAAKTKLGDCGVSKDEACSATIRFAPHSYTTSAVIEPGKNITVFNAAKAALSF
jgi:hypothetical protein